LISKYDLDEYDSVVLEDLENCERGIVLADRLGESVSDIVSGGLAARVDCARVGVVSRWKFGLNF
jgi:hypothetical protein